MRRRIQSESELKIAKPPLVAHSRSLNLSCDAKSCEMQLIGHEKDSAQNPVQVANIEIPSTTDPENNLLLSNIRDNTYGNSCESDNISLPRDFGRPTSLSSVTSSRTSRGSDYFSSSSGIDGHPSVTVQNSGLELHSEITVVDGPGNRAVLNKVVESVPEEEEGFVDDNILAPDSREGEMQKLIESTSNKLESEKFSNGVSKSLSKDEKEISKVVSPKDINKKLSEVNFLSPVATQAMVSNPDLSYVDRIVIELLETEGMYVRALEDILAQYVIPLKNLAADSFLHDSDVDNLFGNIKDIYAFNRKLLSYLENCDKDPVKIAQHFVSQDSAFSIYTTYCTNYPISVAILTRCMKNPTLAQFFKNQQELSGHNLPLGAYLLKPVQRILKYHLILQIAVFDSKLLCHFAPNKGVTQTQTVAQGLVKNCDRALKNYRIIEKALETMTNIAHHINDMKRKNEDTVHVQEIQSLLSNWQGDDLTVYGDLVMEGELKLQGAKNWRVVFLFDKMILITKKQDGFLVCKANIMCSDLTMLDGIKENPLSFRISHFDTPSNFNNHHSSKIGKEYTLTAKSMDDKSEWTHNIKKMMLKHHHANIPLQAKQSILNMNTAGLDEPAGSEENHHRVPLRRIQSGLTSYTLANGKTRRRSDSVSKKSLPLRPWKKFEHDMSDDVSSDSVPNTPTLNHPKPRFSFPRISLSKTDSIGDDCNVPNEKTGKSKKERKNDAKKSEKYKESVIYRRHLRRTSQPITDFEKRLSVRASSDQEESEDAQKPVVSFEDFDSLEDFLSFNVENKRESLSWDLQIVEPFFEQLKQEKEQREALVAQRRAENITISMIPMPNRKSYLAVSSTSNDSSSEPEYSTQQESPSNHTPQTAVAVPSNKTFSNSSKTANDGSGALEIISSSDANVIEKRTSETIVQDTVCTKDQSQSFEVEDEKEKKNSIAPVESSRKDETVKVGLALLPKIKRPLSTQLSNTDRRRYFDRLKESRDRRHSQLALGSDAKAIQTGKVREMIEHHQEQMMTSQAHIVGSSSNRKTFDKNSLSKRSDSSDCHSNQKAFSSLKSNDFPATVVLRRPRDSERKSINESRNVDNFSANRYRAGSKKQNYRSMDLEIVDPDNRFSALTTASLPLHFTSSSSSSCSSGNEDQLCNSPKSATTSKAVLQSEMVLWRSYLEETGSNRRRSKNLVIQASPDRGDSSTSTANAEKKFLFKDVGKINAIENKQTDKLSEEVDCVWHKLESRQKCHPNELDSPINPHSDFNTESNSPSTNATENKQSSPTEVFPSKETTNAFKSSLSIMTNSAQDENQTKLTAQNTRYDVNKRKTADRQQKEQKRQGRIIQRKSAILSGESKISVAKLTQKYNQLSTDTPTIRPTLRRSQSAGARKHLSDLRLSTFNPNDQSKCDNTTKQESKKLAGYNRTIDRSTSPPRNRASADRKSVEINKSENKERGRSHSNLTSSTSEPSPTASSPFTSSSSTDEVTFKATNDGIASQRTQSISSNLDISLMINSEQSSSTTAPSLVKALSKPANDVTCEPSSIDFLPATGNENSAFSGTNSSPSVEEHFRSAVDVTANDAAHSECCRSTSDISAASTPENSLSSIGSSFSLVEELCKPPAVIIKSNDVINCHISHSNLLTLHKITPATASEMSSSPATSLMVEELCKPSSAAFENDVTDHSQSFQNEDRSSSESESSKSSDFVARFCKI